MRWGGAGVGCNPVGVGGGGGFLLSMIVWGIFHSNEEVEQPYRVICNVMTTIN